MAAELPAALSAAIAAMLENRSGRDVSARAERISLAYRDGQASSGVVAGNADAFAYAVARMPATYAATREVLERLIELAPDFSPATLLDVGAGPGTASWAAGDAFPDLAEITQLDHNAAFLDLARSLAAEAEAPALRTPRQIVGDLLAAGAAARVDSAAGGAGALPAGGDLVILGYALAELPPRAQAEIVAALWTAAGGALVIVEPGTPAGYARIIAARDRLIALGARILAPCPHEAACPIVAPDWCHFAVRLPRSRAHRAAKSAQLAYEDEKFSYVVAIRDTPAWPAGRLVDRPEQSKIGIDAKICGADGAISLTRIPKRDRGAFAAARRWRWGDAV